jgi:hypothetical protein
MRCSQTTNKAVADRLPSDHDAVESRRGELTQVGRTDRPQVELPRDLSVAPGEMIRVALDGTGYSTEVAETLAGTPVIRHVADNDRLARERAGTNQLAEWVRTADVTIGNAVTVDVVTEGYMYGIRTPGQRAVYTATEQPDSSLADIAAELDS